METDSTYVLTLPRVKRLFLVGNFSLKLNDYYCYYHHYHYHYQVHSVSF